MTGRHESVLPTTKKRPAGPRRAGSFTSDVRQRQVLPVVNQLDCIGALKALGEENRIRIVSLLFRETLLDVGAISSQLGISPYNVSKHLRILREAGIVEVEKRGREHIYGLRESIRRQGEGAVLDLGCCNFQFE